MTVIANFSRRDLLKGAAVNDVLELVGGHRHILARSNPGAEYIPETALLEHLLKPADTTDLGAIDVREDSGERGGVLRALRTAATCHSENIIHQTHDSSFWNKKRSDGRVVP